MDSSQFQKIFKECIGNIRFQYHKRNYYYNNEDLVIVINKQKSNFGNYFYINYGFLVKSIHNGLNSPKISDCDIVGRFVYNNQGVERTDFQVEMIQETEFRKCIEDNLAKKIIPVMNAGIEKYFELFPRAKNVATLDLKKYLGI